MLTLKVEGMSCDHCTRTITSAIHAIDAEAGVQVDLTQGLVNVHSRAASESIKAAIIDSGYEITHESHTHH
ncbi:MAG: cation transporter [Bdellovibrionota bacterium]|nr:MAG: copper chaperone [Pseudomonadota bacterium]